MKTYKVMRMPKSVQWGVYEISTGYNRLVEGGFFERYAAELAAISWQRGENG